MQEKSGIFSSVAENVEFIVKGENGYIFESKNLAEKIRYVLNNRDKLKYIGCEGRKVFEEFFTLNKFEEKWIEY